MDILCTRCGEPWDTASLTDDMTPEEARKLKAGEGCPCCIDKEPCTFEQSCDECGLNYEGHCRNRMFKPMADDARAIQKELSGILGDDIDGLAGIMEDTGLI